MSEQPQTSVDQPAPSGAAPVAASPPPADERNGSAAKPTATSAKLDAVAAPAPVRGKQSWNDLKARMKRDKTTRLGINFLDRNIDSHLKDLDVDEIDDDRHMLVGRHKLVNFGSDSFLGLDRDKRVQQAIIDAVPRYGTHNGASRAFWSISLCSEAESRIARWLGVPSTMMYTSVTLANVGLIPALVCKGDLLVVDRQSHDSIQQGAKLAAAGGAILKELFPCDAATLRALLQREQYKSFTVAVDGIYSMSGKIAPLAELEEVTNEFGGTIYVDDAHGTGVVGPRGRGAAYKIFGSLEGRMVSGSLSKAFSCMGAFVTCEPELHRMLKIKTSTFIFGGPVPPPYLAAIIAACEIIDSDEGEQLIGKLQSKIKRFTQGLHERGFVVLGEAGAIISVLVGDLEKTLKAGKWMFDRGYYVQSATYPAVAINEGLLRIQINANHSDTDIDGLLAALEELRTVFPLPRANA